MAKFIRSILLSTLCSGAIIAHAQVNNGASYSQIAQNINPEDIPYVDQQMLAAAAAEYKNQPSAKPEQKVNTGSKFDGPRVQPQKFIKKAPIITKPIIWLDLYDQVEVDQARLKGADLMLINSSNSSLIKKIAAYDLGAAPPAGQLLVINHNELLDNLKMGFPLYDFRISNPGEINIKRRAEEFSANDLDLLIKNFEQQAQNLSALPDISYFKPPKNQLLAGTGWQAEIKLLNSSNQEFRNWQINFRNGQNIPQQVRISGRINNLKQLANAQTISTASDNKGTKTQATDIVGLASITAVSTNQADTKSVQPRQPLVKRGSQLLLKLDSQALSISIAATAMDEGDIGDFIRVKNNNSQKIISAQIIGPNQVAITN